MNGTTVVPKGTGGAWHTAAEGVPQSDNRLYVAGDAPWFAPILFEKDGTVTPGQDGVNNPFHAPLKVVTNPDGSGSVRFENAVDWSAGMGGTGSSGATPQAPYNPQAGYTVGAKVAAVEAAVGDLKAALGIQ